MNDRQTLIQTDSIANRQPGRPEPRPDHAGEVVESIPVVREWSSETSAPARDFSLTPFPVGIAYCRGPLKRAFDLTLSLAALILLLPPLLAVALLVALTSSGPVFYWQARFGLDGRTFRLWKFRTMRPGADQGPLITASGDRRVTALGRVLRATKIDELPQLMNVVRGEMSIVGPRPQTAPYVEACKEEYGRILRVRPGLTDPATIEFRHEESILEAIPEDRRDAYYKTRILRRKISLNMEYIQNASLVYDLRLVGRTVMVLAQRKRGLPAMTNAPASRPEV